METITLIIVIVITSASAPALSFAHLWLAWKTRIKKKMQPTYYHELHRDYYKFLFLHS